MQTRRRDEDAHEEENPPDEVDKEEEDSEVSEETDGPEVVGRNLRVVSIATRSRRDSSSLQPGHLGLGNHPSEEDEAEQARVWFSRLLHALCARRNAWKEDV